MSASTFLFAAYYGGNSWMAAARQISDVPVAKFEVFCSVVHIADIHAGILIEITKPIKDV
jgi:hypothetical protein